MFLLFVLLYYLQINQFIIFYLLSYQKILNLINMKKDNKLHRGRI